VGPRVPMTVGPLVAAVGLLLLSRIGPGASYVVDVLPGVIVFGLGLSFTVAPLTATVLASASQRHAGVASGVNNAIARSAGLLIVAALPLLIGLSGDAYADPVLLEPAFAQSMMLCAGLLVLAGVLSAVSLRHAARPTEPETAEVEVAEPGAAEPRAAAVEVEPSPCRVHCAIAGTPLHPSAQTQPPTQTRA
jgi:hypothetical protein